MMSKAPDLVEQDYSDGTRKFHLIDPSHGEQITPDGYNYHGVKKELEPYTMTIQKNYDRMGIVWDQLRRICDEGIPGDFVETGVWRGGICILATDYIRFRKQGKGGVDSQGNPLERKVWLYDTFEGMPQPSEKDGDKAWERYMYYKKNDVPWCAASVEDVKRNFKDCNLDLENPQVIFVKGPVEETLKDPKNQPEKICFLRCDTDFYESTKVTIEHLWDKVVPGGAICFDDYGRWPGQRRAVDEFFHKVLALYPDAIKFRPLSDKDRSCIIGVKK